MKKKILLIDDKGEFRYLLNVILSGKYDIRTAENGLEALAMLHDNYFPDLIISDLMMPKVGGAQLLEQLKASEVYQYIPVIILSSIDDSSSKTNLIKAGAADYLEKPFNPAELEARIERIIAV